MVQPFTTAKPPTRATEDIIEEAEGLARAIWLKVLKTRIAKVQKINPASYIGKGTVEDIAHDIEELQPSVVIVNQALSPVQQRNLETSWKAKVIDRTGLILEIFGERARTKEGRLQVELAALEYQRSRLVRSWTHLERQRGGAGFMGGPGETQIELDRRLISDRITKLKKELENVRRTRDLGRKSRERVPYPIVSLVGYTNAGKSTLFNTLTNAGVFAKDLLFATLDPTMRRLKLPTKQEVILADTVGFISDLPTHLVESFRATLEQITSADVILHVIDVSRPDYRQQREDVVAILKDLEVDYETDTRIIEVYNKIDKLSGDRLSDFKRLTSFGKTRSVPLSALKGEGKESLLNEISKLTGAGRGEIIFKLRPEDGRALAWLYAHGEVLQKKVTEKEIRIKVRLHDSDREKFSAQFNYKPSGSRQRTKTKT
ncbi:MAG: GTPase HflX [Alphaproteobacteria bacterium]|nr:GTPase HflX [Alphaproteobacteria bacterium]MBP7757710.1 GTPase HflX [Alphaproteobacteria bacterium]MBP7761090.1 GTPase HflX [Alphaproteobacteria bacterium]